MEWRGTAGSKRLEWAYFGVSLTRKHSTLHKADTQSGTQRNGTERNGAKWKSSAGTQRSQTEQNATQ